VSCIVKDEPEHKTHNELIAGALVLGLSSDGIGIIRGGWKCWSAQVAIMAMISTPS